MYVWFNNNTRSLFVLQLHARQADVTRNSLPVTSPHVDTTRRNVSDAAPSSPQRRPGHQWIDACDVVTNNDYLQQLLQRRAQPDSLASYDVARSLTDIVTMAAASRGSQTRANFTTIVQQSPPEKRSQNYNTPAIFHTVINWVASISRDRVI